MLDLATLESLRAALGQPLDDNLKTLLRDRLADTVECGLQDLTHVLVIEAQDTEAAVVEAIGFSPLRSSLEARDWLEQHDGWWEALYCVGNSGFAYILLIEDAEASPFAAVCRAGRQP